MTKRFLSLLTTIVMVVGLVSAIPAWAETYSGSCGDNANWSLNTDIGMLTISGTGDMTDYNIYWGEDPPWNNSYITYIQSVNIESGITSIGNMAFILCRSLVSVTIPNSVTSIGDWAFEDTPWLENKQKENPLVVINGILIDGTTCSGDITIPNSVTSIGGSAFRGCNSLTSVTLGNSVTSIENAAFYDCNSLTSVSIGNGVTSIENYAFEDCHSLTSIAIGNSVTSIGERAFARCESLTSITIGKIVTSIGEDAFVACNNLTIKCYKGSYAEQYAIDNNIKYEIIGEGSSGSTGGTSGSQTGSSIKTSTDYRYRKKYENIKDISIYEMKKKFNDSDNFAVPGLETTNVLENACDTMVPQGICTTDEYILITAYDDIEGYKKDLKEKIKKEDNKAKLENEANHTKHNSVIYVLDKKTNEYKVTLVLPYQKHVGGIAFDGTYVWIANTASVSAIPLSDINEKVTTAKNNTSDSASVDYETTIKVKDVANADDSLVASFITYYNKQLWIGTFNSNSEGVFQAFNVNGLTLSATNNKINLPKKSNGAAFCEVNSNTYLIVNTSHGRKDKNNSQIYKWNNLENKKDEAISVLPPMTEEVCVDYDTNKIYTIFESASTPYSTVSTYKCNLPVDRVCVSDIYNYFGMCPPISGYNARSLSRSYTTTDENGNIYESDDKGNITYFEDTDGFWYRSEYDENGNEISCEYSDGYVDNNTYDKNGTMLSSYCTSSDGTWVKASYSNGGNITSYEDSDNFWYKSTFDENENEIYYEDSDNYSYEQTFDEAGNIIYHEDNEGFWYKAEYDQDGNETYYENSKGYWSKKTYDEYGEVISSDEGNKSIQSTTNVTAKPVINSTIKYPAKSTKVTRSVAQVKKDKTTAKKAMKQAKITKLTAKSKGKKITVTWKNVKKAVGYQVQVSTNKKFKKKNIVFDKFTNKKKLIINNGKIKSKKTYYVRVRVYATYKDTNNKPQRVYSKWVKKVRKVKVK